MKLYTPGLALGVGLLLLTACDHHVDLKTQKAKYSYAVGQQIGRNMKMQRIELDTAAFDQGLADMLGGKKARMSNEEMRDAMRKFMQSRQQKNDQQAGENKKKGEEFLAANRKKDGVKVTASGLQYKILRKGKGPKPKKSDTVVVNYRGTLIDGKEFDSSYKRHEPAEFPVNAVIPGWTEALQMMHVGSKWKLFIPSNLAYGSHGNPTIPANSVLIFEVELLKIKKAMTK